jgi:multiple sugar transport system substrate-binding protein
MDGYLETVRAIHKAMAPRVHGTVGQWRSGHYSLICDACAWLWANGGSIFGPDGRPRVNDDRAVVAMEFMLELGKYMPPGVTTWDWHDEASAFARGEAGIFIQAGEWFSSFDDPKTSRVVGLVEPAPCPRETLLRSAKECSFDETPGISRQGGSCLAISRHSRNIDAAWVFLQWATSSDVTTRACLLAGGSTPIRHSNFSDPRVKERDKVTVGTTRFFEATLDAILHRMGTEPHLPAWSDLAVNSFAVELGKLTTGQQSIRATLDSMARAAEAALEKR